MKFLITGNTGFKGSWLSLLLKQLGHQVFGVALPAPKESLYQVAGIDRVVSKQAFIDIRNPIELEDFVLQVDPDYIVHLAAQPIVRESYLNPRETFEVNAMGTFNLLEATKNLTNLISCIVITTDKVYKNLEKKEAYHESDPLGGHDPYSSSKAMADILTQSWALSFSKKPIFIARAGNVVGGGDFSTDRLIPDIFRAWSTNSSLQVRYPNAVRPWQHVLDCLNGYLQLVGEMNEHESPSAWNFGPDPQAFKSVQNIIDKIKTDFEWEFEIELSEATDLHEATLLTLDSSKSNKRLGWKNKLDYDETINWTIQWYENFYKNKDILKFTNSQINSFLDLSI